MLCALHTTCLDVVLRENYPLPTPLLRTGRGWLRFAMVLSSERLLSFVNNTRIIGKLDSFFFFFEFQLHCPWFCSKLIFVQAKPEQSEKINDLFLSFLWSLQPIGVEIEGNLKLLELQLENVEGGKMEVIPLHSNFVFSLFETQVHGFGPLNWLAGRKVSDLVQETLLQVIFDIFKIF